MQLSRSVTITDYEISARNRSAQEGWVYRLRYHQRCYGKYFMCSLKLLYVVLTYVKAFPYRFRRYYFSGILE